MTDKKSAGNTADWENYFKWRGVSPDFYSEGALSKYISNALPADKSSVVVDIGCGYGQVLKRVVGAGYSSAYGIEPSAGACKQAESWGLKVLNGYVQDVLADIPAKADFAYMLHVLEHIPKDLVIPTLSMIRERLLKNTGRLLIAVPNAQSYTNAYWRYEDWTHETLFTSGSLIYVLKAAGFSNVEIYDADCCVGLTKWKRFLKRTALGVYKLRYRFNCKITSSSTHQPSPSVYSFEVKAIASV